MTKRVCAEPGCPVLTDTTRCTTHTRAKDKARGTRQARGYGAGHDQRRMRWALVVAKGGVNCARCGKPIDPHEAWDLGHHDTDRTQYTGPEHASCNRSAPRRTAS